MEPASQTLDFHKAITVKERSSRYIRTAFDFLVRNKGEAALDNLLNEVGLERDSSVYKHITDDDNWNSYEMEILLTEKISELFDDPYQAVWDFGVASGSGKFDQKSSLFTVKTKIAPIRVILTKISERTEEVSLISTCTAQEIEARKDSPYPRNARVVFNYDRLPEGISSPHWTSILAGAGIVYGVVHFRKGLDCVLHINKWPNLPSDFPTWRGERYIHDEASGDVKHERTGEVVGNSKQGPFQLGDVLFNNGHEASFEVEWKPEGVVKVLADMTVFRRRRKREEEQAAYRQKLTNELTREHQAQLARYEKELSEKTEIIRQQKIQQDGDYFLTSLLTNPVNRNSNASQYVTTEFYLDQKKKFTFRNRQGMLGGDLCITDQVTLSGKSYTVVFNGDAMGKSLQGAGGALVMGALFLSHMNRTKSSSVSRSPKQFIAQMYKEMQHIFLIFDGSMSMSIFLGLVEESSGMLYYINCEHPWSVIYRDGKASFIETELVLRKIGYEMEGGNRNEVPVQEFLMHPGDSLIVGSDGRDDLAIAREGGIRIINEDEFEFVRTIDEAGADLEEIVKICNRKGEITDDLSLVKISFVAKAPGMGGEKKTADSGELEESNKAAEEKYAEALKAIESGDKEAGIELLEEYLDIRGVDLDALYRLAKLYYGQKDFDKTIEIIDEWRSQSGHDSAHRQELTYYQACAYKMQRSFALGARLGEEVREAEPNFVNNLLNLVDCYRHLKDWPKATTILEEVLALDPKNAIAQQLKAAVERSRV